MTSVLAVERNPGRLLAHPVAIVAIVTMVVNDHVLKGLFPGSLTGKLSDVAGLVFFPLLLIEVARLVDPSARSAPWPSKHVPIAIAATGISFALVKMTTAGGLAFAWGLGAAQWLITLGFASGTAIRPVAVAIDPSDLAALPALAVAWLIVVRTDRGIRWPDVSLDGGSMKRSRRALGVVLIAAAAFSTLATSRSVPESVGEVHVPVAIDAEKSVVVRHISWTLGGFDGSATGVLLAVDAQEVGATSPEMTLDVAPVTVLPDENTELSLAFASDPLERRSFDLTEQCRLGCDGGATLIVRHDPARDAVAEFELVPRIVVTDVEMATIDIREDPERRVDTPSRVMTRLEQTVRVTDADPDQRTEALLKVRGDVLDAPLAFPLVGRVLARVEVSAGATATEAHEAGLQLPDDHVWFTADYGTVDRDWLTHCHPHQDCEIVVTLQSRYDLTRDGTVMPSESETGGFVELRWTVDVLLEAFDDRPLPVDALKLEVFNRSP